MSRFGGLSEERPSVFKTRSKLGTHLSTQCSGDERQSRHCAALVGKLKRTQEIGKFTQGTPNCNTNPKATVFCTPKEPVLESSELITSRLTGAGTLLPPVYGESWAKGHETGILDSTFPRWSTASDLSRQLSSGTHMTVSRQTMYRRLGLIGLYARRLGTCVPLTATHCRLRLTWSREHVLRTTQQWSCVMFSDESRFSLQSDSRRTLIWRAPGTRCHQENTIERHRYGGTGWLVWGGIILGSRTDLHVQSVMMTGHIYQDVILEHVRLFRDAMGAEFLFMDDNSCPHRANIVDECLQSEDITRMD
ncbi:transposable element Tcb1 transposase [Trichonephila clavipes]|nr:transposable element Tcb1 transposase [Trichonephila clavipes]